MRRLTEIRLGGACLSVDLQQVGGDQLLVMSPSSEQLARIAELVAGAEVRVEISQVLSLAEVQQADELSESGHTRGKIVLKV